jgi:hypothetical protein
MPDFNISLTLGLSLLLASLLIAIWEGFMPIRERLAYLTKHKADLLKNIHVQQQVHAAMVAQMFSGDDTTKH